MSALTSTPPHVTGYLLLFRGANWPDSSLSPDEISLVLDRVNAWFGQLSATGKLVGAQPLMEEGVVISGKGGSAVTDGPFSEAKEVVGGYVLLSVESLEEAIAVAKSNPMNEFGTVTEVRPTASSCPHLYRVFSQAAEAVA